jgi:BirA family biotin operon repressor/biotin-[acetyl-CoA-carboxylase] ligase
MREPLPDDLAAALAAAGTRLGAFSRVSYQPEVGSTNDLALALAADGEPEGTVVVADQQRTGRGRRGREWFSPHGAGVYLSAIVRPHGPAGAVPLLTLGVGAAAASAVQTMTSLPVELKWPNDLVIGRPWRKLGGVLCETSGQGTRIDAVVVGLGINVGAAAYPREIGDRATSIEAELGRPIDRAPLIAEILAALAAMAGRFHRADYEHICQEWRRFGAASLGGAPVRWQDRDRERRGRARDIDRDGALVVESDGGMERLVAGEVRWEGLSRD